MLDWLRQWVRAHEDGPYIRPWGLAAPILVLIVALPLLRPLRQPTDISENERQRLATVQAIVERHALELEGTAFYPKPPKHLQATARPAPKVSQPPVLAALLAGPYWVMCQGGLTFDSNQTMAAYLLTLVGATLPVVLAAGVIYRMGRLLELRRPWRTLLAFACIFGSGLISYATVINAHAPAASLVVAACGALFHGAITRQHGRATGWLALAGFAASLAAVIDLGAAVFLLLLPAVVVAMDWPVASRTIGLGCYVLGAIPPLLLHVALTAPMTGDLRPGFLHERADTAAIAAKGDEYAEWDDEAGKSHLMDALAGSHGVLSHFPVVLVGLAGLGVILRRHWPAATKWLAVVSLGGAAVIVGVYSFGGADWDQPMFAARWFILFMPLLVFWAGAWLRQSHSPLIWSVAAFLLMFSVVTSLFGAAAPFTRTRPGEYTAWAAARQVFRGAPADRR